MKVESLMSRNVLTAEEGESLAVAAQKMWWADIRHLPVMRNDRLVGVLSELDLLAYGASSGAPLEDGTVRDAMSYDVEVCRPEDELSDVASRMASRKVGCMPVMRGESLVGIVTTNDLVGAIARGSEPVASASSPTVGVFMRRAPVTVHPDDYLLDAAAKMAERNIRHLPVIDGERRVVGILSDRDIRNAIGDPRQALTSDGLPTSLRLQRVGDRMTPGVLTVETDAPLLEVATRFAGERFGAIPVVDSDERLVGIVSYVDVMRELVRRAAASADAFAATAG